VFHVELHQFPHVARAFNLSAGELEARFLQPWVAARPLELDDRRWTPEKAKLKIYEGPRLRPEEIGLGRGWANVTRSGEDVTTRMVDEAKARRTPDSPASFRRLKLDLTARAGEEALPIADALALARAQHPGSRASEQLALAEQAIWELLHQHGLRMMRGDRELAPEEWQTVLLDWEVWAGRAVPEVLLAAAA
jgi:hypothetical protein